MIENTSPTVANCTFSGNTANQGGGMFNINGSPSVTNCTFSYNSANSYGGRMLFNNSRPKVSKFISNHNSGSSGRPEITTIDTTRLSYSVVVCIRA